MTIAAFMSKSLAGGQKHSSVDLGTLDLDLPEAPKYHTASKTLKMVTTNRQKNQIHCDSFLEARSKHMALHIYHAVLVNFDKE